MDRLQKEAIVSKCSGPDYQCEKVGSTKAELLWEGIIFLIHLFARVILLIKKLKIEITKAT